MKKLDRVFKRLRYKYDEYPNIDSDSIYLHWWKERVNLGDVVNKFIVEKISRKNIIWSSTKSNKDHFCCIGSVIHNCNNNSTIWGSGIISDNKLPIFSPKEVLAVRGPKTRDVLLKNNIKCPDVYGDPALLLPKLIDFKPVNKKYSLGIIPHYINKDDAFFQREIHDDVLIIDIESDDIYKFIEQITSCELILSSSLHGIIIADAFNVPAYHIDFKKKTSGGLFKFHDYYLSVERELLNPIRVNKDTSWSSLKSLNKEYHLNIDTSDLISVCPFNNL